MFLISLLFLFSCARPLSWDVVTKSDGPFSYGPPTNIVFQLNSNRAGEDASHTLMFDIREGDLETYRSVVAYSPEFTFNGFLAAGPAGSQVGSYSVDFDFDGNVDFTIPVYSIDDTHAYADRDVLGFFNGIDSTLSYANSHGNHVFTTTLPFGGDGSSQTITGPFSERVTAVINSGILRNPSAQGTYLVTGTFTSVDPDTDGQTNGQGEEPRILNRSWNLVMVSADIPVPDSKQGFPLFAAIADPVVSANLSAARPVGIGSVAQGGSTLSVRVALSRFNGAVDIYGAFIMQSQPDRVNILNPDGTSFTTFALNDIQNALQTGIPPAGADPWLKDVTGSVNARLFDIGTEDVPPGTYEVYLLVTPVGDLAGYYLWSSSFAVAH